MTYGIQSSNPSDSCLLLTNSDIKKTEECLERKQNAQVMNSAKHILRYKGKATFSDLKKKKQTNKLENSFSTENPARQGCEGRERGNRW